MSNESTDRMTRSMFQRGAGGCKHLSLSLSLCPLTHPSTDTHTKFSPFFISFVAPHACGAVTIYTFLSVGDRYMCVFVCRGDCKRVTDSLSSVFVCTSVYYECVCDVCNSGYICVRVLSSRAKTLRSDKRSLI